MMPIMTVQIFDFGVGGSFDDRLGVSKKTRARDLPKAEIYFPI